jgi:hypothetical protein
MAGVAVLAAQHAAVDAQAHADAGAPGDVGAVVEALQRAPAALGLQRGHGIVLDAHAGEARAQRRLDRAVIQSFGRPRAGPAMPPQMLGVASSTMPSCSTKGPARRRRRACTAASTPASAQASSTMRITWRATASLLPVLAVGSLRRPTQRPVPVLRLTATLVPPMSMQAFMGASFLGLSVSVRSLQQAPPAPRSC